MSDRTVEHATFTLERTYNALPARVFAAFADPAQKARWFGPETGDNVVDLDFTVGGTESMSGDIEGGPSFRYDAVYQDIVADERIVYTYDMHLDGRRISVSVATIELLPDGERTRLILTEQGVYLDGLDQPAFREKGTNDLLDKLATTLD
ncbi:MAG: SRPBCC domain-containing protein [Pseudonocardiales bacterium]|nr:SRPBCC domain-containing protein [Pseudonocardiales bacterium]